MSSTTETFTDAPYADIAQPVSGDALWVVASFWKDGYATSELLSVDSFVLDTRDRQMFDNETPEQYLSWAIDEFAEKHDIELDGP